MVATGAVALTLLAGTLALTFTGHLVGAALAPGGLLMAVLVLPLSISVPSGVAASQAVYRRSHERSRRACFASVRAVAGQPRHWPFRGGGEPAPWSRFESTGLPLTPINFRCRFLLIA